MEIKLKVAVAVGCESKLMETTLERAKVETLRAVVKNEVGRVKIDREEVVTM